MIAFWLTTPLSTSGSESDIVLDEGYFLSPGEWILGENMPPEGTDFSMVGRIAELGERLASLPQPSDTLEYTYSMDALRVDFTFRDKRCGSVTSGSCRIYADTTPDADYLHPETFSDGELVLDGIPTRIDLCPELNPSFIAYYVFTGGSWFSLLQGERDHVPAIGFGNIRCCEFDSDLQEYGYDAKADMVLDFQDGVAIKSATWSIIKRLLGGEDH